MLADSTADAVPVSPASSQARADSSAWRADSLEHVFGAIAERLGGDLGVVAIHLETGRRAAWNEERRLPMASVYKLPIAVEVLRRVDHGILSLADSMTIEPRDFVGGANPLARTAGGRPVTATIGRLLAYMVSESDNTATDALLRAVGGPAVVEDRMRALGIGAIDVSRYEAEMFAEARGSSGPDPTDLRNTATPAALAELLALVHEGEGLTAESRQLLLHLLTATSVGPARIKGLLPPGGAVAHKTGTFGPVTNDVGIVTLPDGTHLAIAVLVRAPGTSLVAREQTVALIARAAYEAFAPAAVGPGPVP
jgi:beta-lactamase class A